MKIQHVDEKLLAPKDSSSITQEEFEKHYNKPVRGYVIISNSEGKVLETPNLVLLSGREFLAQKLADIPSPSNLPAKTADEFDLSKFKIRYFGVGTGGASTGTVPSKIGPHDNDLDLLNPGKFADVSSDTESTLNLGQRFQYINNGKLKKIRSSSGGNIEILKEDHIISVLPDGSSTATEITVPAYTTVKYTMIVDKSELFKDSSNPGEKPFAFNEAALYAVEHVDQIEGGTTYSVPKAVDGNQYLPNTKCFARFTSLTKWLEVEDSLKIEWFILV